MHTWSRLRAVPAIALAAALLVAGPALADVASTHDATSDFWHDTRSSGDDPYPGNPDWGNPDLRRAVYDHGSTKVRVRLRMARLRVHDGGYWEAEARLLTDEGVKRRVTLFRPTDGTNHLTWSGRRDCAVHGRVDWADDVFVIAVPRSCLGNPETVAFKAATRWWPTNDDYPYLDVAGTDGYRLDKWTPALARD